MPRPIDELAVDCSFKKMACRAKSLELETLRPLILDTMWSGVSCIFDSISVRDSLDVASSIDADALRVSVVD